MPCPSSCLWTWTRTLSDKLFKFDWKSWRTRLAGTRPDTVSVATGGVNKTDVVTAVKVVVVEFGFFIVAFG